MSRNPYLAASRPSSSFTRSSRTSKRNDSSTLLGRSRSSAALSNLSSSVSSYAAATGYTPSSTWQRSTSSSRLNRQGSDLTNSNLLAASNRAGDYVPSNQQSLKSTSGLERSPLYRVSSSHNLGESARKDCGNEGNDHLQNYQQSKLQQSNAIGSSLPALDSKDSRCRTSNNSLNSSGTELSYDESDSISVKGASVGQGISSSVPRHLRNQGNLLKSQSLDAVQHNQQYDTATLLSGTMSVDRLLLRAETMTERELRKSCKELAIENERLKMHLKSVDEREKQKQQDWLRKERQFERKISELEEENRLLEQWKQESQRLKDENSSLIRVLSKLSKKQN